MKKTLVCLLLLALCVGLLAGCNNAKSPDEPASVDDIEYVETDHPMLQVNDSMGPVLTASGQLVIPCEKFTVLVTVDPDDLRSEFSRVNSTGVINISGSLSAITLDPDRIYGDFENFVTLQSNIYYNEEKYFDVVRDDNGQHTFEFIDEGNTVVHYTRISFKQYQSAGGTETEMFSVFVAVENEGRLVYINYICGPQQEPAMVAIYNTIVFVAPSTETAAPDDPGDNGDDADDNDAADTAA